MCSASNWESEGVSLTYQAACLFPVSCFSFEVSRVWARRLIGAEIKGW